MRCWHKTGILTAILLWSALAAFSQETRIIDWGAELNSADPAIGKGIKRLQGNVWLRHKNLMLTCDSAYVDETTNKFRGFSRVHIIKADTLHVYSRTIDYDGEAELARLEGNVLMDNGKESLKAPRLDYNMKEEVAYYYGGGQVIDSSNTVESFWGYYYLKLNEIIFKDGVTVTNPDNTLFTDSLKYNSKTEAMSFEGPSQIFSDTNYIACNRGMYDSKNRKSIFTRNVFMQAKEQLLKTDSLIYDQAAKHTLAYRNVEMKDTVDNMIITGQLLFYDEPSNRFQVTEDVTYIMAGEKDSLFLHADTLISSREPETKSRRIKAFPHVQFYRTDIQGKCDSLDYLVVDSLIHLFKDPVIWVSSNQLTSDTLGVYLRKDGIDRMEMRNKGFMASREDSTLYNQIKGKLIKGYFLNEKLHHIEVTGNGESIFYPKDGEQIIGQNKAQSSNIRIYFANDKIDRIAFITDPDSKLTPVKDLGIKDMFLEGFKWLEDKRPLSREDIRTWK